MDNLDAIADNLQKLSIHELDSKNVDITNLSLKDWERVRQLESKAIIGDGGTILKEIMANYSSTYKKHGTTLDEHINTSPAWGFYDGRMASIFINTDIVKDPDLIQIKLRHEAVELMMQKKELDLQTVAYQIGITPETIKYDPYNGLAHYVALFYELRLANDLGMLDKDLEFRRTFTGRVVKDIFIPMFKSISDGSQYYDRKQEFKASAGEYAKLSFLIPRQIAENILNNSK